MRPPTIRFDENLILAYERLRAQILSSGITSPLSRTDRSIISEGLFCWAIHRQITSQKVTVMASEAVPLTTLSSNNHEYSENRIINLIASMAIQSITNNQKAA